jgi:tetratricopeptide (TPR) repeat protein
VERLRQGRPRAELLDLVGQPLLGKDPRMWQALSEMRGDAEAAPTALLQGAAANVGRKSVSRILNYYRGVAALRRGDKETARTAWLSAVGAGLSTPWATQNLAYLLREQVLELAQTGRWSDVVVMADRLTTPSRLAERGGATSAFEDRILAETIGLACYHLGYEAAQGGQWSTAVSHWRKANEYLTSRYLAQNLALAEEALGNWVQAAEAWRDMVRRRPRKPDHPDYLTDVQVAAIWSHAAYCYERVGVTNEQIACLKHALEYAPDDAAIRLKLADAMSQAERDWTAQSQLEQLLEREPENVEALLRLAALYDQSWYYEPAPLWRRVLAIEPQNSEARDSLAQDYIARVQGTPDRPRTWAEAMGRSAADKIALLEEGLKELPDHPKLLLEIGTVYAGQKGQGKKARDYLLRAFKAAPDKADIVGPLLHELFHADAEATVAELLPQVRQMPGLLPGFWINQGAMILHCKLGEAWATSFFDEAIILAEQQPHGDITKAGIMIDVFEAAYGKGSKDLIEWYELRIRDEVPGSGAVEYLDAHHLYHKQRDVKGAQKMLRRAQQVARKANDAGVLSRIEMIEGILGLGSLGLPDLYRLFEQFGRRRMPFDFPDEEADW